MLLVPALVKARTGEMAGLHEGYGLICTVSVVTENPPCPG